MCDAIYYYKEFVFYFAMVTIFIAVIYMSRFAKSRGIDFNSIFGLFEVYRLVFSFKYKKLSALVLLVMYGNMLLWLVALGLNHWGGTEGCIFKLSGKLAGD